MRVKNVFPAGFLFETIRMLTKIPQSLIIYQQYLKRKSGAKRTTGTKQVKHALGTLFYEWCLQRACIFIYGNGINVTISGNGALTIGVRVSAP